MRFPTAFLLAAAISAPAAAEVIYVDASATGANDGSSWTDAYVDLQSALAAARQHDQVWVAAGTYKPSSTGDRSASFTLAFLVDLYGGFAGTETSLAERAGLFDATILSGDLRGNDGPGFANTDDNSEHVVASTWAKCAFDGFTVEGGNARDGDGGGVHLPSPGEMRVENCIFRANQAAGDGGAVWHRFSSWSTFRRCLFVGNRAGVSGGALYSETMVLPISIESCRFLGNTAGERGGALVSYDFLEMVDCEFSGNAVVGGQGGGGASVWALVSSNCSFSDNSAVGSAHGGGGVLALSPYIHMRNCVLWGNVDDSGSVEAAQIRLVVHSGSTEIEGSCIQGWTGQLDGGIGNVFGDPRFLDAHGPDGVAGTIDDDLRLGVGSACVDTGVEPFSDLPLPARDLGGVARLVDSLACESGGVLDIGAHERQAIDGSTSYCAQPPTSLGFPAEISARCVASVAAGPLLVRVGPVSSPTGRVFCGSERAAKTFGADLLCVGGEVHRLPVLARSGEFLSLALDLADPSAAALVPGSTWHFQALFRDSGTLRLSDATTITFRE